MNKKADNLRTQLVHLLADGQYHSGEALGEKLGVSRMAISKHIAVLSELGLDIFKVQGKGYKLQTLVSLLSAAEIEKQLPGDISAYASLDVLNVIDSTNDYLKSRLSELSPGYTCLAEAQTAGRGRQGRRWVSPFAASLYMSTYWQFADGYQAASGLSLAVGVAIARALKKSMAIEVGLKWPNDIYVDAKKLAGVLIEVEGQFGASCDCIIGIGLNVHLPEKITGIDQPFTDLSQTTQRLIDRNSLSATLINETTAMLRQFEQEGLSPFVDEWRERNVFADKVVKLVHGEHVHKGVCRGINDNGGLLLENENGLKAFYGGEISVRAAD